jgi:hypothetical protein
MEDYNMQFALTPTGKIGLVTKTYPDGTFKMMLWDQDDSYYGHATIQPNPVHPDVDKFKMAIASIKNMGGKASFF